MFRFCVAGLNVKGSLLHSRWRWRRLEVFQMRLNKPRSFQIKEYVFCFCYHKALTFSRS